MVFFGHLGITAGLLKLYENTLHKKLGGGKPLDYRAVLIGSVLPDLIDKPVGVFLFRNVFHNSRIFMHSLLVIALLFIAGLLLLKRRKNNKLLLLSVGCLIHIVLDSMWMFPGIFYWPFLGLQFPVRPAGDWAMEGFRHLLSDPLTLFSEIGGFFYISYLFMKAFIKHRFKTFLKEGIL